MSKAMDALRTCDFQIEGHSICFGIHGVSIQSDGNNMLFNYVLIPYSALPKLVEGLSKVI